MLRNRTNRMLQTARTGPACPYCGAEMRHGSVATVWRCEACRIAVDADDERLTPKGIETRTATARHEGHEERQRRGGGKDTEKLNG